MCQDEIFSKQITTVMLSMQAISCALLAQFIYIDYIRAVYVVTVECAFKQVAELRP